MASRLFVTLGCVLLTACFEPVGGPRRDAAVAGKDAASAHDASIGDAAADAPDVGGGDAAGELPDAGSDAPDASSPDACSPETDSQLCSALGLTCGPGRGVDLCGVVRDVDCGPCGTLPICDPLTSGPCERICSRDGFSWAYPRPLGNSLKGISGAAANDVWIVGSFGTILHWDGTNLRRVPTGSTATFSAVQAFSSSEVWATGTGVAPATLRWNGTVWEAVPGGVVGASLWGSSPTDVWVDRANHWNGTGWTSFPTGLPSSATMWGTASNDLWSYEADLFHFDGTSWARVQNDSQACRVNGGSIAGTSASDVWAGRMQCLKHWDGTAWSAQPSPSTQNLLTLAAGGSQVFALFGTETYRRSSSGWDLVLTLPPEVRAERMWTDGNEFWFSNPGLSHWDGASLTSFQTAWTKLSVTQAWGSPDDLWAVSSESPVAGRWNGRDWTLFDLSGHATLFRDVSGSSPSDVWVVGDRSALLHWDGASWSAIPAPPAGELRKVYATGPNDAWISGDSAFLRWDGNAWKVAPAPSPAAVLSMWGASSDDIWASSAGHGIRHFDGKTWNPVSLPSPPGAEFSKIWGSRADDVWAFGSAPSQDVLLHWDGVAWSSIPQPYNRWNVQFACGVGEGVVAFSSSVFAEGLSVTRHYAWNGTQFERRPDEMVFWDTPVQGCVSNAAGDLALVLSDGSVLQRSGRWR